MTRRQYRTNFGRSFPLDDEPPEAFNTGCCLAVLASVAVWVAIVVGVMYLILK